MTNSLTIKLLGVMRDWDYGDIKYYNEREALDNAIGALKKQEPITPLDENKYYGIGKCPSCKAVFMDRTTKYCGNCGQALDWRNTDG